MLPPLQLITMWGRRAIAAGNANAVPCAGEVLINGNPRVTCTACPAADHKRCLPNADTSPPLSGVNAISEWFAAADCVEEFLKPFICCHLLCADNAVSIIGNVC